MDELTTTEQQALAQYETVIETGLQTFYEVGTALLAIRDNRLYRQDYSTFEDYCRERWEMTPQHAGRMIQAAKITANLEPMGSIPSSERQARELAPLEPDAQRIVWEVVQQTAPDGRVTAAHVKSVAEVFKSVVETGALDDDGDGFSVSVPDILKARITEETYERLQRQREHINGKNGGVPPALQASANNEWYTPAEYIEAARAVMGGIDLDPASNPIANETVRAAEYFTIEDDGLSRDWYGRVFLNPPYGRDGGESNQEIWSTRLIGDYEQGEVTEAILLVNAVTDRAWFQGLWNYPICFTNHRIRFYDPNGELGQPVTGNALVYFGRHCQRFAEVFKQFGPVVLEVVR